MRAVMVAAVALSLSACASTSKVASPPQDTTASKVIPPGQVVPTGPGTYQVSGDNRTCRRECDFYWANQHAVAAAGDYCYKQFGLINIFVRDTDEAYFTQVRDGTPVTLTLKFRMGAGTRVTLTFSCGPGP